MNGERKIFLISANVAGRDKSAKTTEAFKETRRDQEICVKQLQTILPMHYKYLASSHTITPVKQTCHSDLEKMPADCHNFGKPCHVTDTQDHFSHATMNYRLMPNRLVGIQGCCNHCAFCRCMNSYCDGGFLPYRCKLSDSMRVNESQKNRRSRNDLLYQRDDRSNKKAATTQQDPEFMNVMKTTSRDRIIPPEQDRIQHVWNKDMQRDSREKFLIEAHKMVVEDKFRAAVGKPSEDNLGEISALQQHDPLNSTAEEHKGSSRSVYNLQHLPTDLICQKQYDEKNRTEDVNKDGRKLCTKICESRQSSELQTAVQNANCSTESNKAQRSLENIHLDDSEEKGYEVEITQNNKVNCKLLVNENGQTAEVSHKSYNKRIIPTSETEYRDVQTPSLPIRRHSSNPILPNKCSNVILSGLYEEIIDFQDGECSKEEAKNPNIIKDMLSRQKSFESCQNASGRSDSSEDKSSPESSRKWSRSDSGLEEKDRPCKGNAKCDSYTLYKGNFVTKDDEEEREISEGDGSQNEEPEEDSEVLEMRQGKLGLTDSGILKTTETKTCTIYQEDTDISSNTEEEVNQEGTIEKYPGYKMDSIVSVKEKETEDTKDRVQDGYIIDSDDDEEEQDEDEDEKNEDEEDNEEEENNEEEEDDNDEEDNEKDGTEESEEEDERTGDKVQQGVIQEENCSIESYKNEAVSGGEEESENNSSEEEKSLCKDQDELEDSDLSEEEENIGLRSRNSKSKELELDEISKNVSLKSITKEEGPKTQTPTRKEESAYLGDQATVSYEDLKEDDQTYTENPRHLWLCCLKSCSLSKSSNKSSENQKRCSEDGSMDLLQLNPVESGSSFPDQALHSSPTFRNTEVASVHKAPSEDSSEELFGKEKPSENPNQGWSDSEDDSFYD
ncbi:uncharacterized protein LOC142214444 [Leptodactylus fuscus]|uniref:uncharacterized protein LOC142214444 n=1 Tax=Leptodactylus fuscus TaxID=238119 RepID=UPI003F4EB304